MHFLCRYTHATHTEPHKIGIESCPWCIYPLLTLCCTQHNRQAIANNKQILQIHAVPTRPLLQVQGREASTNNVQLLLTSSVQCGRLTCREGMHCARRSSQAKQHTHL
jgi:hypothetical protein